MLYSFEAGEFIEDELPPYPVHELALAFPRMNDERYAELKADIQQHGLKTPILLHQGEVIDGRHRQDILVELGLCLLPEYYTELPENEDPRDTVWRLNGLRRDLNVSQRAMIYTRLYPPMPEGRPTVTEDVKPGNFARLSRPETANASGVSDRTLGSARRVEQAEIPGLCDAVVAGDVKVSDAANVVAKHEPELVQQALELREERKANNEYVPTLSSAVTILQGVELANNPPALPTGEYYTVVVDPPWDITNGGAGASREQQEGFDYPVMSVESIRDLSLPLSTDSWVFLWTTCGYLPQAIEVLKDWGLKYRYTFVWHKNAGNKQPLGPLYNAEYIVVGSKGSPRWMDVKDLPLCFNAATTGHSVKPDEFYDMLRRCTPEPRIDMFNRRPIDGFDTWGIKLNDGVNK